MKYFEKYVSNTCGANSNQHVFNMPDSRIRTGRIFYKIFAGGEYNYSLLFSTVMDSTYKTSFPNSICDEWKIESLKIGKCKAFPQNKSLDEMIMGEDIIVADFIDLTFSGQSFKEANGEKLFSSDPVKLSLDKGDYLCVEIKFSGKRIPCHEESVLPIYIWGDDGWKYSTLMPAPIMVGCDRAVSAKIAYLGDSITQGIGPQYNSYLHWCALLSDKIGDKYSYWNLGIGCGQAYDAATGGIWLRKAKECDTVFVCFGVNDINQNHSAEQIIADLDKIIMELNSAGCKIILQTVPPFDYPREHKEVWEKVNKYIKNVLSEYVLLVFDNNTILSANKEEPHIAKYGGHPNKEGNILWANMLYESLKDII